MSTSRFHVGKVLLIVVDNAFYDALMDRHMIGSSISGEVPGVATYQRGKQKSMKMGSSSVFFLTNPKAHRLSHEGNYDWKEDEKPFFFVEDVEDEDEAIKNRFLLGMYLRTRMVGNGTTEQHSDSQPKKLSAESCGKGLSYRYPRFPPSYIF